MRIEEEELTESMEVADLALGQSIGQEETKKPNLKKKLSSTSITAQIDMAPDQTCQSLDLYMIRPESS